MRDLFISNLENVARQVDPGIVMDQSAKTFISNLLEIIGTNILVSAQMNARGPINVRNVTRCNQGIVGRGRASVRKRRSRRIDRCSKSDNGQSSGLTFTPVVGLMPPNVHINANAVIYLTAILEYLAAEIIQVAVNDAGGRLITKRIVQQSINSDPELWTIF